LNILALITFCISLSSFASGTEDPDMDQTIDDLKSKNKQLKSDIKKTKTIKKLTGQNQELKLIFDCEKGVMDHCSELGLHYMRSGKKSKAIKTWKMGCKGANLKSCYNLGTYYLRKRNTSLAIAPFKAACKKGHALSCNSLAAVYHRKRKPKLTQSYFEKACTLKLGQACANLSLIYKKSGEIDQVDKYQKLACLYGMKTLCSDEEQDGPKTKK
jgi:TPR repeat protein